MPFIAILIWVWCGLGMKYGAYGGGGAAGGYIMKPDLYHAPASWTMGSSCSLYSCSLLC